MNYIYKKRVIPLGHNDGDNITAENDILVNIFESNEKAKNAINELDYKLYRELPKYLNLDENTKLKLLKFLNVKNEYSNWEKSLNEITFRQFTELKKLIKISFFKLVQDESELQFFYPIFNTDLIDEIGFRSLTFDYGNLEEYVDNLKSKTRQEALEKGLFLLLLKNDVPDYVGNPETTSEKAEFLDSMFDFREKMLKMYQTKKFGFFGSKISETLISKHNCLKFWILINPFRVDKSLLPNFIENKETILGEKVNHFNLLVDLISNGKEKLIMVKNVC